jgi:hypothetical protein
MSKPEIYQLLNEYISKSEMLIIKIDQGKTCSFILFPKNAIKKTKIAIPPNIIIVSMLGPLLFRMIAPKIERTGKMRGVIKKILFNVSSFGNFALKFKSEFLLYAMKVKIKRKISKLTSRETNDKGLSIPTKGKVELINNPPNIKKVTLNPIV